MKIGATHLLYLCHNIRFMAERMEKKLYEYKQAQLEEGDFADIMCGLHTES